MSKSKIKENELVKKTSVVEIVFWWVARAFLLVGVFTADSTIKKVFIVISLLFTFLVSMVKKIFKGSDFAESLDPHLQTCISLTAALGAGIGFGLGVFKLFPEYGILLHLYGGIIGVAIGYYISIAMRKPKTSKDYNYTTLMAFSISCAFIVPRKILQFFLDFFTGRNLIKCFFVDDDHWLFSVIGHMNSMYEQRPLYDYSEDLLFGLVGTVLATAVLYIYFRANNKSAFKKDKKKFSFSLKSIPSRCVDKVIYEIQKVKQETNICDMLIWWCTRALMLYAFITMQDRAEATLLLVIFIGTFAISILHFISPKDSMFCRLNYKVQTLVTVIAFFGSYVGNYISIYNIIGRYDTFLHFISGFISFTAGYYLALTLVKPGTKKENFSICVFAFAFALAIIPIHETVEFVGDYIWGTTNQGFMWEPSDNILLYNLFGHGVGNELLIRIYDTIYDMSLATVTSTLSFVFMSLILSFKKEDKKANPVALSKEKETVNC